MTARCYLGGILEEFSSILLILCFMYWLDYLVQNQHAPEWFGDIFWKYATWPYRLTLLVDPDVELRIETACALYDERACCVDRAMTLKAREIGEACVGNMSMDRLLALFRKSAAHR